MSYGFTAKNNYNQILISSDTRNLHFIGKAYLYNALKSEDGYGGLRQWSFRIGTAKNIQPLPFFTMTGSEYYGITAIRQISIANSVFYVTPPISIEGQLVKTYAWNSTPETILEGSNNTYSITTSNVITGTVLYWSISFNNSNDFEYTDGSFIIGSAGTGSFQITPTKFFDPYPEVAENYTVTVRQYSATGPTVLSKTISVSNQISTNITGFGWTTNANWGPNIISEGGNSTSTTPPNAFVITATQGNNSVIATSSPITLASEKPETYAFSSLNLSMNEGTRYTVTVTTTDVPNTTVVYWEIPNASNEFLSTSGNFIISNNTGEFNVTPTSFYDAYAETDETYNIVLKRFDGTTYNTVKTSVAITVVNVANTLATTALGWNTNISWGTGTVIEGTVGSGTPNSTTGTIPTNVFVVTDADPQNTTISTSFPITLASEKPETYTFSSLSLTMNEGTSYTVKITTTDVPDNTVVYWELPSAANEFLSTSGSFIVTTNIGSFNVTPTSFYDAYAETDETYNIVLKRFDGTTYNTVKTSAAITVVNVANTLATTALGWNTNTSWGTDTVIEGTVGSGTPNSTTGTIPTNVFVVTDADPQNTVIITSPVITLPTEKLETYTFSSLNLTMNEGTSYTVTVTTTNVPDNTVVYWELPSTANEFLSTSGSFTVTTNTGSFTVTPTSFYDAYVETDETYNIVLKRFDGTTYNTVKTSAAITVVNVANISATTSLGWNTNTSWGTSTVIEGTVGSGTPNSTTGIIPTNVFVVTDADPANTVIATSSVITLPTEKLETYTFSSINYSMTEGVASTVTITTTNVPDNTVVYWELQSAANEFVSTSGNFTVTTNTGSFIVTPTKFYDPFQEGSEIYNIILKRFDGTTYNAVATSTTKITLANSNNTTATTALGWNTNSSWGTGTLVEGTVGSGIPTSTTMPTNVFVVTDADPQNTVIVTSSIITLPTEKIETYTFSSVSYTMTEGTPSTVTVTTTNVQNNTIVYWELQNSQNEFLNISGTFTVTNNTGSFVVTPTSFYDPYQEVSETYNIILKRFNGTVYNTVKTSSAIIVNAFNSTATTGLGWNISNSWGTGTLVEGVVGSGTPNTATGILPANVFVVTDSTPGNPVYATSFPITVRSQAAESYSFYNLPVAMIEGSSSAVTVNTNAVPDGTVINWTLNSTSSNNFVADSGTFTVYNNTATFSITPINIYDAYVEPDPDTFTITLSKQFGNPDNLTIETFITSNSIVITPSTSTQTTTFGWNTNALWGTDPISEGVVAVGSPDDTAGTIPTNVFVITDKDPQNTVIATSGDIRIDADNSGSTAIFDVTPGLTGWIGTPSNQLSLTNNGGQGTAFVYTTYPIGTTLYWNLSTGNTSLDRYSTNFKQTEGFVTVVAGGGQQYNGVTINQAYVVIDYENSNDSQADFINKGLISTWNTTSNTIYTSNGSIKRFKLGFKLGDNTGPDLLVDGTYGGTTYSTAGKMNVYLRSIYNTPGTLLAWHGPWCTNQLLTEGTRYVFYITNDSIYLPTVTWSIEHITTTASDFTTASGTALPITSSTSFIFITPAIDGTRETPQTFRILVTQDGYTIKSPIITILPSNDITAPGIIAPLTITENQSFTCTAKTVGLADGIYYWRINKPTTTGNTVADYDIGPPVTGDFNYFYGPVTMIGNTGTFTVPALPINSITEAQEYFTISLVTKTTVTRTWNIIDVTTNGINDFDAVTGTTTPGGFNWSYFTITAKPDSVTEGTEKFTISIRDKDNNLPELCSSGQISVLDVSQLTPPIAPYFTGPSRVYEGIQNTFTVKTAGLADGTYYWRINDGTTSTVVNQNNANSSGDFGVQWGNITITNNTGTVDITAVSDGTIEFDETFTISVVDKAGTNYRYWSINPVLPATTADFNVAAGTCIPGGYNWWYFTVNATADSLTEGTEKFTISIRETSIAGNIKFTSGELSISDISLSPTPTVPYISGPTTLVEGTKYTYTVNNISTYNGSTLYWRIDKPTNNTINQNGTSADFLKYYGAITIANGSATFDITPYLDGVSEFDETMTISVVTGAKANYRYWSIDDVTTTAALDFQSPSGVCTPGGFNWWYFTVNALADSLTEGTEKFTISIRDGSATGTVKFTSGELNISDFSLSPTPTIPYISGPTTLVENTTYTYTINNVSAYNGSTLYWRIDDITTTTSKTSPTTGDFPAFYGPITVANGIGTFDLTPYADAISEFDERFAVSVVTGAKANYRYWSINPISPASTADFPTASLSGVCTPGGFNWWYFTANAVADSLTEGTEKFTISIRETSTTGTVKFTSGELNISDISLTPAPSTIYISGPTTVVENTKYTYTINNASAYNGNTLYWKINDISIGNIINQDGTSSDFTKYYGPVTIANGTGTFDITPYADGISEFDERFTVSVVTAAKANYRYWSINPISPASTADFPTTSLSGVCTPGGFNWWYFTVNTTADSLTEGTEKFTISIREINTTGNVKFTSGELNISDFSLTPALSTIYISGPKTAVEGTVAQYTVNNASAYNGSTLYWKINNTSTNYTINQDGTSTGDFSKYYGSVTIANGTGTFDITPYADGVIEFEEKFTVSVVTAAKANYRYWSINPISPASTADFPTTSLSGVCTPGGYNWWYFTVNTTADSLTEGTEKFSISIRETSTTGTVKFTSGELSISDFSLTPNPTTVYISGPKTAVEGTQAQYTINNAGVADGTYYWRINDISTSTIPDILPTSTGDFTTSWGTVTITNNTGTFNITPYADGVLEYEEKFTVSVVNKAAADKYWTINHITSSPADFPAASLSGTCTPGGYNWWYFNINALADSLTEGTEKFNVQIRQGSTTGTILTTSGAISITDSSLGGTYALLPVESREAININVTVFTPGVTPGTTLYWEINHITTTDLDFVTTFGSFTASSNGGLITVKAINYDAQELDEGFTIGVRTQPKYIWEVELLRSGTSNTVPEVYIFAQADAATLSPTETVGLRVMRDDGTPSFDSRLAPLVITNATTAIPPNVAAPDWNGGGVGDQGQNSDQTNCRLDVGNSAAPTNYNSYNMGSIPTKPIYFYPSLGQSEKEVDWSGNWTYIYGYGGVNKTYSTRYAFYFAFYRSGISRSGNYVNAGWITADHGCYYKTEEDGAFIGIETGGGGYSGGRWPYSNQTLNLSSGVCLISDGALYD